MKKSIVAILAVCYFLVSCDEPLILSSSLFVPAAWSNSSVVKTRYGLLEGEEDSGGTFVWRGIPYARAPVGNLRWKAPQAPLPWEGIRKAVRFGAGSVQFMPVTGMTIGSEDCLYLNVWRPQSANILLPVYVFIHGGGNTIGSANMVSDYFGHASASRSNMVFVSLNYRLGIFGWFHHSALQDGDEGLSASGNFGTLDIIEALKWVQENIASFGGDPGSVTIAGESAGALNVLSLMASPQASGLFHRAVAQSPVTSIATPEKARSSSDLIVKLLLADEGKAPEDLSDEAVRAFLYSKKPAEMMAVLKPWKSVLGMVDMPTVAGDGLTIPEEGFAVFRKDDFNRVPLIIGSNKEETKLFAALDFSFDYTTQEYALSAKYASLRWKADHVDSIADMISSRKGTVPVYVYRFDWGAPDEYGWSPLPGTCGQKFGAFHTLEIPFFLGTDTIEGPLLTWRLFSKENEKGRNRLSADIMIMLKAFAETGDPNSHGNSALPSWKPWPSGGKESLNMVFDADLDNPRYSYSMERVTRAGIETRLRDDAPGSLYTTVMDRLGWNKQE